MTDQTVTELRVTYFGLSELESDALLDLYADHAYKFAERHKHETPLIGSRSWPTEEAWETDAPLHPQNGACVAAGEPGTDSGDAGACGGECEAAGALRRDVRALTTALAESTDARDRMLTENERLRGQLDEAHAGLLIAVKGNIPLVKRAEKAEATVGRVRAAVVDATRFCDTPEDPDPCAVHNHVLVRAVRDALDGGTEVSG